MLVQRREVLQIRSELDLVRIRQVVRNWAVELKFSLVEQTKVVTAASELGRNALVYGKGGILTLESLQNMGTVGLRLDFKDEGPGIPDLELALKDGYTTGGGLGMGLPGAKRLANEFKIASKVGEGTWVEIIKWKNK